MSEHDVEASHQEPPSSVVIGRGLKILGETVVPGASLVLDGKILPGAAHLVGGLVARWAFGPVGWLLVAASVVSICSECVHRCVEAASRNHDDKSDDKSDTRAIYRSARKPCAMAGKWRARSRW